MRGLQNGTFLIFIIIVSLAFALVVSPFYGAILWGVVAAIMFAPLNRKLLSLMPKRKNLAAVVALFALIALVIDRKSVV